ncbi:response regulator [Trinickia acidisoli]|uniref:response regulator n=1 Tax=Trinickia acidisoli TaxID=2767482 RepID=UPI001A90AEBF|nr:response regulator [Trinickia acidisoli]
MATILVIEDNPANMKLARFLLVNAGHAVLEADRAEAGIALAYDARPDLILLDIQLPGMDGLAAAGRLKSGARTSDIQIYAFTGLAMKGDREKILASGFDGYITKPISVGTFLEEIERALQRDSPTSPSAPNDRDSSAERNR